MVPPALSKYIEGLKAHDVDGIAGVVADELTFVGISKTLDKEQFLQMLRAIYTGFPDWHYDHDEPELRGESMAIRWRQSGTHTGQLALPGMEPIPATGRKVTIPDQFFFYKVRGEKIVEIRPDPVPGGAPHGIFEQLGMPFPDEG